MRKSRVGRPEDVLFAVKKMAATSAEKNVTKNVVYREVLLHRRQPPPPQVPVPNTPAIPLESDLSSALDHLSVYDNRQEDVQPSLSATLPSNVTLAPLPTAREAEVISVAKKQLLNCANRPLPIWSLSKLLTRLGWPP